MMLSFKFQQFKSTINRSSKWNKTTDNSRVSVELLLLLTQRQNSSLPDPVLLFRWRTRRASPGRGLGKVQITLHFLCSVSSVFHDLLHNWSSVFYYKTSLHASCTHDVTTWHNPSMPQSPWLYPERYASHWEIWDFQNSPRILDGSSGLCSTGNHYQLATPLYLNILWPPTSAKYLNKISATATGPTSRIFCP